ncbi:MAG: helix-hairpin-helix domain-containing protein [Chloroflexota bacterium]
MPRPSDVEPPSNAELARIFHEIGDLLEIKGELVFKTVAYHRAADAIDRAPIAIGRAYAEGRPPEIPGVGRATADKIGELARTGRLGYHEQLVAEFPATLRELLSVPGLGPKTVRQLWTSLGIADLTSLRAAAEAGRLRGLRGLSARTEQAILEGIQVVGDRHGRMRLDEAGAAVELVTSGLEGVEGVARVVAAGSWRRRRETVGDLDILVETTNAGPVIERFTTMSATASVINLGTEKAAIRLATGTQVDLMRMAPGAVGTYLIHFTGSRAHNVRLRERARERGWSLSEKGFLRIGEDGETPRGTGGQAASGPGGEVASGPGGDLRTFPTEAAAYAFLDLPFIEPELREDAGEIEAALENRLPSLVALADLRGDLHSHSDWSDGTQPISVMAEAARRRGHAYQVLTDHSASLAIAGGLTPERVALQADVIRQLNRRFADEEQAGVAPAETSAEGFRLLHGCELEIRADGRLDYGDELLSRFDLVVASLHVGRRQPRSELTARVLTAIRNPHVDVIAHPSGRKIGERDELDLDWDVIYAEAARTGTVLEMNGSPPRLDLSVDRARHAVGLGCLLSIDSDAHRVAELDYLDWGISQARRAWVEPANVLNTRSREDLLAYVRRDDR